MRRVKRLKSAGANLEGILTTDVIGREHWDQATSEMQHEYLEWLAAPVWSRPRRQRT
jgi:hypothetical protein